MSRQKRQVNLRSAYDEGKSWPGKGAWISWTDGTYKATVPSGKYQLVLYKGPEYHIVDKTITIEAGKESEVAVDMERWLDLGYKVTPSAGTDFPVMGHVGQERTFVKIDGKLNRQKWKESLLDGKVFISNAPVLELDVNGRGVGDEVLVKPGEEIKVTARASINPDFDKLDRLELVAHGKVIKSVSSKTGETELKLEVKLTTEHGLWLAVRAYGKDSAKAHSGIVYVLTEGQDGFWNYERAEELVAVYQQRLVDAMENASMEDPRIWATGGGLKKMWEGALPANTARAKAAKEALDVRLAEINRSRPEKMNRPVVR